MRPESIGLNQSRSRSHEWVVNAISWFEKALEKDIDKLRDELPQVRMKTVNVLRALDLRELIL
jgi:hypothetical protein